MTREGIQWLDLQFLSDFPSRFPAKAGIHSALIGTLWLISLTALFSVPIGIGAGLYLEEFTKKNRIRQFVDLNISNLGGVPSIVYGMLGLVIFVRWFELNQSVLAGSLTMSLLILPVIIISTREALRGVSPILLDKRHSPWEQRAGKLFIACSSSSISRNSYRHYTCVIESDR
ncbi:MAG: hypothetical protein CM1200mP16_07020 [Nitrospina sp.]|nr:MAG: hypothetical protein CM1200mP16_07020 [Nitrospina sp.]